MNDVIDPTAFSTSYSPAIVALVDGTEMFAAHQRVTEAGWLWTLDWDRTSRKIPPQRVASVELVETDVVERDDYDAPAQRRVVDPDLRERARARGRPQREVVEA